jgi:hypothetical protein
MPANIFFTRADTKNAAPFQNSTGSANPMDIMMAIIKPGISVNSFGR